MPAALAAASMSRSSRDPQRASPVSTPSLSFRSPHLGARHACWLSDASYRPWETQPVLHLLEAGGHGPWRGFLRHQWTEGWLSRDSSCLLQGECLAFFYTTFTSSHLQPTPGRQFWLSQSGVWGLQEPQPGRQSPDPCPPALLPLGPCKPGQTAQCLCEMPRRAPGPQQGAALWCQTWKQTDSTEGREEGKAGACVKGACG